MKSGRITRLFAALKKESRCGLIAYVTAGDPDLQSTVDIVVALAEAGADAIELGVPFSDPIADGPVIQAAAQRALGKGVTLADVLEAARQIRSRSAIPLILFSYLNPILRYGVDRLAVDASAAGIDGVLLTDLPPEAATEVRTRMRAQSLELIFLLAPTSSSKRIAAIDRATEGFIYYVSTTGVTGTRKDLDPELVGRLDEIRSQVRHPIAVGFGVSAPEHYELLRDHADAVVVGSAIVRAIAEGEATGAADRAAAVVGRVLGKR